MKRLTLAIFVLVLLQNFSLGASKSPRMNASVSSSSSASTLTSGLALPILPDSGETAIGLNFGWLTEVGSKLYVGTDMGIHFWGKAAGGTDSVTALQLLPTVLYHLKGGSQWTPYIGLSAGPYHYVSKPAGAPGVDFALLFRPGLNWNIADSFVINLEAKYGELGGLLIVMPVVSAAFTL